MQPAKDVAASAKSGMEKTKATMQEKAEKMTTRDPLQKEIATEKKEERVHGAERQKHEAKQAARQTASAAGHPIPGVYVPHDMDRLPDMPEAGTGLGSAGVGAPDMLHSYY